MDFCPCCLPPELFQKHNWYLCFHSLTSELIFIYSQADAPETLVCHIAHYFPKAEDLEQMALHQWENKCPLSVHPNGPLQTHLISTFWCPRATSRCSSPWKLPSLSAQGHNSSSLLSLESYFPILPPGNSFSHSKSCTTGFFLHETFPWALSRMFHSICASTGHFLGLCPELISPVLLGN